VNGYTRITTAGWSATARLLAFSLSLESAFAGGLEVSAGWLEAGFRELIFSGPARAGELSGISRSARGFFEGVGELPPDTHERAKRFAGTARRPGVPGFAGYASLSADHEPLTGDAACVISSLAEEGLFRLVARIGLTGLGRPRGDFVSGLPPVGEGGNVYLRARSLASPQFRRRGVRGASVAFTDLSHARRATFGRDMGMFLPGAILGTSGTASLVARPRLWADLTPAFPGKLAALAMVTGSFTLSVRHPVSQARIPRHPPRDPLRPEPGPDAVPEYPELLPEHRVRPRDLSPAVARASRTLLCRMAAARPYCHLGSDGHARSGSSRNRPCRQAAPRPG
jgi:hypothetical protein